jgi:hypothetical protein
MRIGPQYYPPRRFGVQVIQRGPHGARFATDPAQPGGGFKWWSEQLLDRNADAHWWQPQQQVVGVLGLGGLGGVWDWLSETAPVKWVADTIVGDSNAGGRYRADVNQTVGTVPQEQKVLLTSRVRSLLASGATSPDLAAQREQIMSVGRWTDTGPGYVAQPTLLSMLSQVQVRRLVDAGRISPSAVDSKGNPRVDDAGKAFRDELGRQLPSAPQVGMGLAGTALAVGAGALLLYSLGTGYGKGLAGRSTSTKKNPARRRRRGR